MIISITTINQITSMETVNRLIAIRPRNIIIIACTINLSIFICIFTRLDQIKVFPDRLGWILGVLPKLGL